MGLELCCMFGHEHVEGDIIIIWDIKYQDILTCCV